MKIFVDHSTEEIDMHLKIADLSKNDSNKLKLEMFLAIFLSETTAV